MANNPGKVASLLRKDPHLHHLTRMLHQQQALLKEIREKLPEPLARHCLHARIAGNRLILHVDSAVWGSQLRFHGQSLLRVLRARAPNLSQLRIRLLFPEAPQESSGTARKAQRPTSLAEAVSDPELRELLKQRRR
jgi:hypothetical protein